MFLDFEICHRMASLQKMSFVTLTYILDFKCLKYVKFISFIMLQDS